MKKFSVGLILIVLFFAFIALMQYCGVKYGNLPSNRNNTSLSPKEKKDISKRFGISLGDTLPGLTDNELNETLDDIASIGITWIRFDMTWEYIQPEKDGPYFWRDHDRIIKTIHERNLKIMPILTYAPGWTGKPPYKKNFMSPAVNRIKFADFAKAAAKHYAPQGIHTWEIWNEPNIDHFWSPKPNPQHYADLLKKSYLNIKQVDPDAVIISGGLAPIRNEEPGRMSALKFLEALYANNADNYFDGVGFHPTSFPQLPSATIARNGWSQMDRPFFKSIHSIMVDNGDKEKKIWATEFGSPTKGVSGVSEELQANMVKDVLNQMKIKPWIKALFWYTYKDLSTNPQSAENYFGLVRRNGTKKPAYYTLKKYLN